MHLAGVSGDRNGGTAPAVLNAADEIAVEAFLDRRIPFPDIPKLIEKVLERASAHQQRIRLNPLLRRTIGQETMLAADWS